MFNNYSIEEWVERASDDQKEFRQAVHTILAAIAQTPDLRDNMVIKGGILLAIRYKSRRFTRDIDFSSPRKLNEIPPAQVAENMDEAFALIVEQLDYDLECKVQSCKVSPANKPDATFPSIDLKIGYAYKGTKKHQRLLSGQCPTVVAVDYSLNEQTPYVEDLKIGSEEHVVAYALTDIISEKFRAILQQVERKRQRRQDIFDLYFLIEANGDFEPDEKYQILCSLVTKCRSRNIEPTIDSMDNSEIYERSKAEYPSLQDEVEGELPDFDQIYGLVRDFYRSLDW